MLSEIGELQAQIVALRLALEGAWMTLLANDPDKAAQVDRLRRENVEALKNFDGGSPQFNEIREAVIHHTDQFWGSVTWTIDNSK